MRRKREGRDVGRASVRGSDPRPNHSPCPKSSHPSSFSSLSSSFVLAQCTSPCVILNLTFVMHRYEERIIELHSVIAELSKKMEEEKDDVIKEESECDESQV